LSNPDRIRPKQNEAERRIVVGHCSGRRLFSCSRTEEVTMLYIAVTLLLLLTAWVIFGWVVSESWNIRWLKNWLALFSVSLLILICGGGGVFLTRKLLIVQQRQSIQAFASQLNARIQEGHPEDALEAIRIIAEGPPEGSDYSSDVLQRMSQVGTRLASEGAGRL
jgi:hypothetical protein